MTTKSSLSCSLVSGNASRFIRSNWISDGRILSVAFDLRDSTPPEKYVSLFVVDGADLDVLFRSAWSIIAKRIPGAKTGAVSILNISEVLGEVNEDSELIKFVDKNLPHCGLIYVTSDPRDIVEVKATLAFVASKFFKPLSDLIEG